METYSKYDSDRTRIVFMNNEKPKGFDDVENYGALQEYKGLRNKTMWERIGIGGSITARPLIHNNMIFFGSCDKNFYALDLDGNEVWRFPTGGTIQSEALVTGNLVVFGCSDKNTYALDYKTGREVWRFVSKGALCDSPMEYGGTIYFGCSDGGIYAINRDGGTLKWVFKTDYPMSLPLIVNDRIYAGYAGGSMYCLSLEGNLIWKYNIGYWIAAWPAAYENGIIYFGCADENLYALDANNGQLKWKFHCDGEVFSPMIEEGFIYVGCAGKKVYCVDSLGNKVWDFKTNDSVANVAIDEDVIYFGCYDNNVYAITKKDGTLIWKFKTQNFVNADPLITTDSVIFGSWDCNLYCLTKGGELKWKFKTSMSEPSKISAPAKTQVKKMELVVEHDDEKKTESRYNSQTGQGASIDTIQYASGMSKTYVTSSKRGYISSDSI